MPSPVMPLSATALAIACASLAALLLGLLSSAAACAAQPSGTLPGIVVVGQRQLSGTPASVERIRADALPARAQRSVSEWLEHVPGVAARDRQNLAQDVQLTIRGFGARSTFGVRGLQIFADGIPATMPDGQGQVSHIPLQSLQRVDVIRGPFSALFGNASGGVIEFVSADPPPRTAAGLRVAAGSDGLFQRDLWLAGPWHPETAGGYRIDAGRLDSRGFRFHSRAQRDIAQARLLTTLGAGTRLALTANSLQLRADDPQGLTLEQAQQSPRAANSGALAFDARKHVRQQQVGLRIEQALGSRNAVTLGVWSGTRSTFQMLSVPVAAQSAPGSSGGVVDLARDYDGADLRWRTDTALAGRPAGVTLGIESQQSREHRRGFENFSGSTLGVIGALRRDQRDAVASHDIYAEARWRLHPRWTVTLGARSSRVDFDSRDAYVTAGNPDDSGALHYRQTTPVAGLLYQPKEGVEWYANAGRGFETPSLSELAYRPDGLSGLNTALRPARSNNSEAGLRLHEGGHALSLAAFASRTRDELAVASNLGGRSTYTNATTSDRRGWELSAAGPLSARWHYALAYSRLDARYRKAFQTCRQPPCSQPDTDVAAGNRIPGTVPQMLWAQLRWRPEGTLEWFLEANAVGRMYADDANTARAPGYALLDGGVETSWSLAGLSIHGFARVDNVFGRRVIGSVIVNDGNGRYFEPAPGRTFEIGLSLQAAAQSTP
ncbi:MAG: TonB-dependent receptor [Xanthomonadaceae bacterium]|nr:TonB-dependent receptor [Xanthomonadaceae bacterium]